MYGSLRKTIKLTKDSKKKYLYKKFYNTYTRKGSSLQRISNDDILDKKVYGNFITYVYKSECIFKYYEKCNLTNIIRKRHMLKFRIKIEKCKNKKVKSSLVSL